MRRSLHIVLPPGDLRPLLVFLNYTGIGDLLLSLPLLGALRPGFRALAVVPSAFAHLMRLLLEDGAVEGYAMTRGALRFDRNVLEHLRVCRELSRLRAAVLLIYGKPGLGYAARLGLLRARRVLFCNPRGPAPWPSSGFEVLPAMGNRAMDYRELGARLGTSVPEAGVRLTRALRDRLRAQAPAPWSAYAVVAAWTNDSRRDARHRFFRRGVEALIGAGLPVVLTGLARDRGKAEELLRGAPRGWTASLVGKTSLPELLGLLAGARIVLANDGGTMHMARMVGTPVIAAFGPNALGTLVERHHAPPVSRTGVHGTFDGCPRRRSSGGGPGHRDAGRPRPSGRAEHPHALLRRRPLPAPTDPVRH